MTEHSKKGLSAAPGLEVRPRKRVTKGLMGKSKEELVSMILRLEARLHRLESQATHVDTRLIATSDAYAPNLASLSFRTHYSVEAYRRLPGNTSRSNDDVAQTTWRVVLLSAEGRHKPLGLDVHDDVVVGRMLPDRKIGLDLVDYDAGLLGVSRRHALLRPSKRSLFLIDLGSKNGTFCNAVRLGVGEAHRLAENDVISFSKLHFRLHLVRRPGQVLR